MPILTQQAFRYELAPTAAQEEFLTSCAGASRFWFNQGLALVKARLDERATGLAVSVPWSYKSLCSEIEMERRAELAPWQDEATPVPTLTLEDYEGALIGVADLAPYSRQAQQLLSRLLPSFYWSLPLYTSASGMPYYDLLQDFVASARGEVDPASAQVCATALRTLLAGYPSAVGAHALAAWTAALGAAGLRS